ncbi:MAG: FAD-dependent oxidoreductase [Candidatus Omnitrophota bacterium]|nr:FAD-dependent oxidoreductase [Candidatus Omnitrophota bacterium]
MEEKNGKFSGWHKKYASSDVIIAGAGPSGLMAALDLARLHLKTLVIERNDHAGGRLWTSDFLIDTSLAASGFREILDEFNIPYKKGKNGLYVNAGANLSSKLISAACDAGVRILNMAEFNEIIYTDGKIEGVAMNWSPALSLEDAVRTSVSVTLKSKLVVDASGRDACVFKSLIKKGIASTEKYSQIDLRNAQTLLLEKTGLLYPGLAVTGMAVSTIYGIPAAGLSLASLLLSGRKAAQEVELFFAEDYLGLQKRRA